LLEIQVMTPAHAAEVARWLWIVHQRKAPIEDQLTRLPEETQRLLAQERTLLEAREHVGFRLGDLRRAHGRLWTPLDPAGARHDFDLSDWQLEPDENFLVPGWELGTSSTRGRAPDGTPLPLPSSPDLERRATELLAHLDGLAGRVVPDVIRICDHDATTARKLFRHGTAVTAGLKQWDGGEFHGADAESIVALALLRVVVGEMAGISPWPQVEAWEAEPHNAEHDRQCARAWVRLKRRSRRLLRDASVSCAGVGQAIFIARASNGDRRRHRAEDGATTFDYDRASIVSTLLFQCSDHAWHTSGDTHVA
jgi:hypothetical protein